MKSQKKGVALIWTLILSTILIITSSTMVSYIIKESQFIVRIEESAQVYAAAKSGTEWAKWYLNNDGVPGIYNFDFLDTGDGNETTVEIVTITGGHEVNSTSSYRNVTRKIKYRLIPSAGSVINPSQLNATRWGRNSESFSLQFDLWTASSAFRAFSLGSQSASGDKLYFDLASNGTITLKAVNNGVLTTSTPANLSPLTPRNTPFSYRVNIKYIEDTAARLTVTKWDLSDPSNSVYLCIGSTDLDLAGQDLGDLYALYVSTPSPGLVEYTSSGNMVDGKYITVKNSAYTSVLDYIDNLYLRK